MKLWGRGEVQKDACLQEIEAQMGDVPEVRKLLDFIRSSDTGVIR